MMHRPLSGPGWAPAAAEDRARRRGLLLGLIAGLCIGIALAAAFFAVRYSYQRGGQTPSRSGAPDPASAIVALQRANQPTVEIFTDRSR